MPCEKILLHMVSVLIVKLIWHQDLETKLKQLNTFSGLSNLVNIHVTFYISLVFYNFRVKVKNGW